MSTLIKFFPGGSHSKESTCNATDPGLIPGSEGSPGEANSNPLQYSCLENPKEQRSLVGWSPWGCKELDTTEQLAHSDQLSKPLPGTWYWEGFRRYVTTSCEKECQSQGMEPPRSRGWRSTQESHVQHSCPEASKWMMRLWTELASDCGRSRLPYWSAEMLSESRGASLRGHGQRCCARLVLDQNRCAEKLCWSGEQRLQHLCLRLSASSLVWDVKFWALTLSFLCGAL